MSGDTNNMLGVFLFKPFKREDGAMKKKHVSILLITALIVTIAPAIVCAWFIPDTGVTKCYNNLSEITCPQPGEPFYGQDAQYSPNLQSFTDLGNGIVRDNVTGLEWQSDTAPGVYLWDDAKTYCDNLTLGGYSDWRLPTIKELSTIVDWSRYNPAININYFPDTQVYACWSSTVVIFNPSHAWVIDFSSGIFSSGRMVEISTYVRAVRGGQYGTLDNSFIDKGDGTVTETNSGLMWQQATAPGYYTWEAALAYCETLTLAGHTDWRLPNVNEVLSLMDYSLWNPAIDTTYFPNTSASAVYWSSTTCVIAPSSAWYATAGDGGVSYLLNEQKLGMNAVRAVRGEQPVTTTTSVQPTTTTTSQPTTTSTVQPTTTTTVLPANANIVIRPETINLKRKGQFITATIKLPQGYKAGDVDIQSIKICIEKNVANGQGNMELACGDFKPQWAIRISKDSLLVKFPNQGVLDLISNNVDINNLPAMVTFWVQWNLKNGGPQFQATDTVRVINSFWWQKN